MFALVEFDKVLTKEQYNSLNEYYDFGKITSRCCRDYDNKLRPMDKEEVYRSEVTGQEINGRLHYFLLKDTEVEIPIYNVKDELNEVEDYIGIENPVHVVDLEKLYTRCPKIQVRILEVAR